MYHHQPYSSIDGPDSNSHEAEYMPTQHLNYVDFGVGVSQKQLFLSRASVSNSGGAATAGGVGEVSMTSGIDVLAMAANSRFGDIGYNG